MTVENKETGGLVLVVDDDPDVCETLQTVLEVSGYRVAAAGNGQEALDALRSGVRPCLVLLDLMMPVMNGQEFRAEQREDPAIAGVPVVVVSGDHRVAEKAVEMGLEGLSKPIDIDDLLHLVGRFCGPPACTC
ncbi:response regulator [Nannocystis sp. ILAH1]|uniref:response regulator n=1 Tax=unclassified Nannocystis TaxID=2627009 RepID=UPI00226EE785|nr:MULTISPECIES: response regulator [unclassified Nannocystis]MCY0993424.1 response regulator [Nannocystis sp. ILAH1]MCY1063848.1 response regulator [Nannocystis sp. RBIL2]